MWNPNKIYLIQRVPELHWFASSLTKIYRCDMELLYLEYNVIEYVSINFKDLLHNSKALYNRLR